MQYDKGFTDEEIEANITTYFQGFAANVTLGPRGTAASSGIGSKDRELIALAFLDAAVCIAAYCAALAATAAQAALGRAVERNVITVSDYTVQVQGLPMSATSEQVCLPPETPHNPPLIMRVPAFNSCCAVRCPPNSCAFT